MHYILHPVQPHHRLFTQELTGTAAEYNPRIIKNKFNIHSIFVQVHKTPDKQTNTPLFVILQRVFFGLLTSQIVWAFLQLFVLAFSW